MLLRIGTNSWLFCAHSFVLGGTNSFISIRQNFGVLLWAVVAGHFDVSVRARQQHFTRRMGHFSAVHSAAMRTYCYTLLFLFSLSSVLTVAVLYIVDCCALAFRGYQMK